MMKNLKGYIEIKQLVDNASLDTCPLLMIRVVKILVKELIEINSVLTKETKKYQKGNKKVTMEDISDVSDYVMKTKDAFLSFKAIEKFCKETGIIFKDIVSISCGFKYSKHKDLDSYLDKNNTIKHLKGISRNNKN